MAAAARERWLEDLRGILAEEADPYEAARRLSRDFRSLPRSERSGALDEALDLLLRERRCYGVVFFLLEGVSDAKVLEGIATRLQPAARLESDDEESHLADLMRVLGAAGGDALMAPVEAYLLERPIGPHWASVPWAIWPRRPELFARAWVRFFIDRDAGDWTHTLLIKSFLTEPDAVLAVREPLERASPRAWNALREALLRQAGDVGWLSRQQREALDRATR